MDIRGNYTDYVSNMQLKKLGNDEEAGLWITSLPVPRNFTDDMTLSGRATYIKGVGQWPGENKCCPRRLLMITDGNNMAPESISLSTASSTQSDQVPKVQMELAEKCSDPGFMWERHMARIDWGNKSVGLLMGLRTGEEIHWWEA